MHDRFLYPVDAINVRGYSKPLHINLYYTYGTYTGNYWLDNVKCKGHETNLTMCISDGWGVHDCSNKETAGVVCRKNSSVVEEKVQSDEAPKFPISVKERHIVSLRNDESLVVAT